VKRKQKEKNKTTEKMPPGVKKGKNGYTVTVAKRHLNLRQAMGLASDLIIAIEYMRLNESDDGGTKCIK
jgi:hypothetical protein